MDKPIISIVVTVFNVEKYISRCLESVLAQSYSNFELVVVDDCTPDKSMAIVKRYANNDTRIKIVSNKDNCGLMWARKVGVENAIGDYIVYLDSDDTLPKDAVLRLYEAAKETGSDFVQGNIIYKKLDNTEEVWTSSLKYGTEPINIYTSLLKGEYRHNLCGHIFKREILANYNYVYYKNFTKWEDYCLFYQLVKNVKKATHIDEPVYYYYQTIGSSTQVKLSERNLETTVIAHKVAYDIMIKYKSLEPYIFKNFQYCFFKIIANGYKNVIPYLKNNDLGMLLSYSNILKYNNFKDAIKLIIMKSPLGVLIQKRLNNRT